MMTDKTYYLIALLALVGSLAFILGFISNRKQ